MTAFITPTLQAAARAYGRDFERMLTHPNVEARMEASDRMRAARKVLSAAQIAVMDLTVTGQTVAQVAQRSGGSVQAIEALFLAACQKLAEHYEAAE